MRVWASLWCITYVHMYVSIYASLHFDAANWPSKYLPSSLIINENSILFFRYALIIKTQTTSFPKRRMFNAFSIKDLATGTTPVSLQLPFCWCPLSTTAIQSTYSSHTEVPQLLDSFPVFPLQETINLFLYYYWYF